MPVVIPESAKSRVLEPHRTGTWLRKNRTKEVSFSDGTPFKDYIINIDITIDLILDLDIDVLR